MRTLPLTSVVRIAHHHRVYLTRNIYGISDSINVRTELKHVAAARKS